jgi:hypothetical protein
MNKLLVTLVASVFTFAAASGYAADAAKKKEELTAEQKTEIRDRAERLKAERAKADQAKTTTPATPAATPAKKAEPKRTSQATTPAAKTAPAATGTTEKKVPAKV